MKKFEKIFNIIALVIMIPTVLLIGIMAIAEATGNRFTAKPKKEVSVNNDHYEDLSVVNNSTEPQTSYVLTEEETLELYKEQAQQALEDSIAPAENNTAPSTTFPLSGQLSDTGSGLFFITTPEGSSKDGNAPVLRISPETAMIQIGYKSESFNRAYLTYIYIDGILNEKEYLSDTQGSLNLSEKMISNGIHLVETVQYDSDTEDGSVITYKKAEYEVKTY